MTKIIFLGTKGEIEESSPNHKYHSSLLLASQNTRILIDYGLLHQYELTEINPDCLLITHAHPDHYIWLKEENSIDVPVYLTRETVEYGKYRPVNFQIIQPNEELRQGPFTILPYQVIHSLRCPAVGFKIQVPENKVFIYNPDLVDIVNKDEILKEVDYYIGDGSAIKSNLVRRKGDALFGHTRITTQINWCKARGIENIIFTHLGKETLEKEKEFAQEHREALLAWDGMEIEIGKISES